MRDLKWTFPQRLVRAFFALPHWLVFGRIGTPITRDGRTLDRRIQFLLALGERTGQTQRAFEPRAMRADLLKLSRFGMPIHSGVDTQDRDIDGLAGPIPVRVYRPLRIAGPAPAIVYLHGGGWVTGDLDSHEGSLRILADTAGCVVVAVHYRLAPEHRYPAAVDDCLSAYLWTQANHASLGTIPGRVGVMGDSAGGNLTAAVCLAARDRGFPPPTAQGLVYPAVDMEFRAASYESVGTGFGLERRTMEWFREQYVPRPEQWRDPLVSPMYAADLSGLPPALVVTAGFDPLRDEGLAYAQSLTQAGVAVRYCCYDDTIHGFFGLGLMPGALDRVIEVCRAMGEMMHASGGAPFPS